MASSGYDDPLGIYLREVAKLPLLAPEEEKELLQHVRNQDGQAEPAAVRLVEANLALVVSIAQRHPSPVVQVLDLLQIGNEALLQAVHTFTPSLTQTFSVYAAACIERAVFEAIAEPT